LSIFPEARRQSYRKPVVNITGGQLSIVPEARYQSYQRRAVNLTGGLLGGEAKGEEDSTHKLHHDTSGAKNIHNYNTFLKVTYRRNRIELDGKRCNWFRKKQKQKRGVCFAFPTAIKKMKMLKRILTVM
jgi:hypothetical protein